MSEFQAIGVIILLFVLRCIAPLLITLGLGYLMNRLVDRWQAEEAAQPAAPPPPAGPQPSVSPAPILFQPALSLPCWLLRNCDEARRNKCAAYGEQSIPCWQAREKAEGALPATCPTCPRFIVAHAPIWQPQA